VIDLHLHTTASDGRSTPDELVREALAAGVRTMAVTDHDTIAGLEAAESAARRAGLEFVRGIEITAVHGGRDVHMLGYFVDAPDAAFLRFLDDQRHDRRRRVVAMIARLHDLGLRIDAGALIDPAETRSGRAVGRPAIASALMAAGHVASIGEAFERYLGEGMPGFVPRQGASPEEVIAHLVRIGAVASMAHPGKMGQDALLPALARAGMAAIEVFHPDHGDADVERYARHARELGLLPTGGSDYHGPGSGRAGALGRVGLPRSAYEALAAHASPPRRA
jgi:predicted metal-dependent phosphoesterase TrpH